MFPEFEKHHHRQGTYGKLDVLKEIKDSSAHWASAVRHALSKLGIPAVNIYQARYNSLVIDPPFAMFSTFYNQLAWWHNIQKQQCFSFKEGVVRERIRMRYKSEPRGLAGSWILSVCLPGNIFLCLWTNVEQGPSVFHTPWCSIFL